MNDLTPLAAPVPPMLEQALGHDHEIDSRLVAFHWEPSGDELTYDDGQRGGTGEWHSWLLFTRHRAIAPHLAGRHFGDSDTPARDWLLLDRRARQLYAASAAVARARLREQWDWTSRSEAGPSPDRDTLKAVMEEAPWREEQRPQDEVMAEVERRMAAQRRLEGELAAWLDGRLAEG